MTCAKGLTAGYAPGGAVLVSDRIAHHFDAEVLACGLTAYAHPIVCAAIVAAVGTIRDEGLVERAASLGTWLGGRLAELARGRPAIGEVRGVGLLWALELVEPGTGTPIPAATAAKVARAIRARRLWMHKRDNLVYLAPPLVSSEADLDEALGRLGAALDEALS